MKKEKAEDFESEDWQVKRESSRQFRRKRRSNYTGFVILEASLKVTGKRKEEACRKAESRDLKRALEARKAESREDLVSKDPHKINFK